MPVFKLRIPAPDLHAGRAASDLLSDLVAPQALAVTLFEDAPRGFVVEAYYDADPGLATIERALAWLDRRLGPAVVVAVPDLNWVAMSQAALPPVVAGRFIVHGSHDRARVGLRPNAIEIEAGEAFGTGHNATTSGCLEALAETARSRRFSRVLDLGCGTAVLAIAAARALPNAQVLACDNDPIATAVARANAHINRVAARVRVVTASGFAHPLLCRPQRFDLVLANILPRPLIALAPSMRRAVRPDGIVVLSGILNEQAREVTAIYRSAGFRLVRKRQLSGWTVLTLARR
ncbi:MAG: 50S ribosomal protein L11 methyltransferase [Hyphomicrobiaceae bacterium]|nr:MAG: 50S ribosomal protein L11 methyltransferase [Hyphomicrobiaceae bacterium]